MKERARENHADLIYLNSSCWSQTKAIYEIPAAGAKKFINIPTTTSMTTFVNAANNPMRAAVHGIRQNLPYAGIRKLMEEDKGYKQLSENVMIFPDEKVYAANIGNALQMPVAIDTKITQVINGVSRPYSIEAHD